MRLQRDGGGTSLPGESAEGLALPLVQSRIETKEDGTYAVRLLREPLAHAEAPQAEQGKALPQQYDTNISRDGADGQYQVMLSQA